MSWITQSVEVTYIKDKGAKECIGNFLSKGVIAVHYERGVAVL